MSKYKNNDCLRFKFEFAEGKFGNVAKLNQNKTEQNSSRGEKSCKSIKCITSSRAISNVKIEKQSAGVEDSSNVRCLLIGCGSESDFWSNILWT